MNTQPSIRRIIRPAQARQRAGISETTFWRNAKEDPTFPTLYRLGVGRSVGMLEDEFDAWLQSRALRSQKQPAGSRC